MPLEKYTICPPTNEASYVLVSMGSVQEHILPYLRDFPVFLSEDESCGMSSTLLWSGSKGNNVPVQLFGGLLTGVVLNPAAVDMPQADLRAMFSYGRIAAEIHKPTTTKYPEKKGYCRSSTLFSTNLARQLHTGPGTSVYLEEGDCSVFAENIWRKYFRENNIGTGKKYLHLMSDAKTQLMVLNEGIVFKKKNIVNPIRGLLLKYSSTEKVNCYSSQTFEHYRAILTKNSSLGFYLYNDEAEEHVMRYLPRDLAMIYLKTDGMGFKEFFESAVSYTQRHPKPYLTLEDSALKMRLLFFQEGLSPLLTININYLIHKNILTLEKARMLNTNLAFLLVHDLYLLVRNQKLDINIALSLSLADYNASSLSEPMVQGFVEKDILSADKACALSKLTYNNSLLKNNYICSIFSKKLISLETALNLTRADYMASALSSGHYLYQLVLKKIIAFDLAIKLSKDHYNNLALSAYPEMKALIEKEIITVEEAFNLSIYDYEHSILPTLSSDLWELIFNKTIPFSALLSLKRPMNGAFETLMLLETLGAKKDKSLPPLQNDIKYLSHTISRIAMRFPSIGMRQQLNCLHQMIKNEFLTGMSDGGITWLLGGSAVARGSFKDAASFSAFFTKDPSTISASRLITAIESVLLLVSYRAINEWRAAPPANPDATHSGFLMHEKIHALFDGKIATFIGDSAYPTRVNEIGEYYTQEDLDKNTVEAEADDVSDVSDAEEDEKKLQAVLTKQVYLEKLNPASDARSWPGAARFGNIPIRSHVSGSLSIVLSVLNELYKRSNEPYIASWFSYDANVRMLAGTLLLPSYERGDFHSIAETTAALEYYLLQREGNTASVLSPYNSLKLGLHYMVNATKEELRALLTDSIIKYLLPNISDAPVLINPSVEDYIAIVKESSNKKLVKDIIDRVIKNNSASTASAEEKVKVLANLLIASQQSLAFDIRRNTLFDPKALHQDAINCILEAQKALCDAKALRL